MKYCIEYSSTFQYLDEVDEIEINFNRQNAALPAFLEKFSNKTIVINATSLLDFNENDIQFFQNLRKKYNNFKLKVNFDLSTAKLKESNIPYFFNTFVGDWQNLYYFLGYNPTDIYITNGLGFDLKNVSSILHNENIQVRVIPNLAQSAFEPKNSFYKFFIRPEDINLYSKYVDICEFFIEEGKKQASTLYEIYKKDKEWFGNLNMLIFNFNEAIDNRTILPTFAERRIDCKQKCLQKNGCQFCQRIANLSKTLENKSLIIQKEE